jgi:hypothetical protein
MSFNTIKGPPFFPKPYYDPTIRSLRDHLRYTRDERNATGLDATGGDITTVTENNIVYKVHTFTSSGNFTVTLGSLDLEVLIVAGGAGGGGGSYTGGGGAGGFSHLSTKAVQGIYNVVVGAGGSGGINGSEILTNIGSNGSSSFFGTIEVPGGGGGGSGGVSNTSSGAGLNLETAATSRIPTIVGSGGGGGGSTINRIGGLAWEAYGNSGGSNSFSSPTNEDRRGGGGGGAGSIGQDATITDAGNGGDGIEIDISGTLTYYAGGGGGGARTTGTAGTGGLGGGANGGIGDGVSGDNGVINTGGGGGGAGLSALGGNGGSGIVIIRYPIDFLE